MTLTWVIVSAIVALIVVALVVPRLHKSQGSPTRSGARVPLEVPVVLRTPDVAAEVLSSDISRGGICLVGDVHASAGQPVELQFALPGHERVAVHGVVRWAQRGKVGILFDLQDRRRIAIGDWIAAQPAEGAQV